MTKIHIMKYYLVILALFIYSASKSQKLEDLKINQTGVMNMYYTFSTMKNKNFAYEPQRTEKYQTFGLEGNIYFFEKMEDRWNISIKFLDDIVWEAAKGVSDKIQAKHPREKYYYSLSGLFWWRQAWNVMGNEGKFNWALGYSLSDYFIILPGVASHGYYDGQPNDIEPHGWYWAAGPAIMADFAIHKQLSLHMQTNYDFSFVRMGKGNRHQTIEGYPKPFFFRNSLVLQTGFGLFTKLDYAQSFDRGEHKQNISRIEFQIGFSAIFD